MAGGGVLDCKEAKSEPTKKNATATQPAHAQVSVNSDLRVNGATRHVRHTDNRFAWATKTKRTKKLSQIAPTKE